MVERKSLAALLGAALGLGVGRLADFALVAGSLATAVGAVGFAGYMTMAGGHKPYIFGMQYLAIYAQPSHLGHGPEIPRPPGVDMAPIGAIASPTVVGGYALVGAKESYAWLRDGNRIFAVRPGDEVPGLGHVAEIAERDGRWALLDDKGAALLIGAQEMAPEGGGRFEKKMIFGDDK